jgi:hypothetical protein
MLRRAGFRSKHHLARQLASHLLIGASEEGIDTDRTLLRAVRSRRVEEILMVLSLRVVLDDCVIYSLPSKARGCGELKKSIFLLDMGDEIKCASLVPSEPISAY